MLQKYTRPWQRIQATTRRQNEQKEMLNWQWQWQNDNLQNTYTERNTATKPSQIDRELQRDAKDKTTKRQNYWKTKTTQM